MNQYTEDPRPVFTRTKINEIYLKAVKTLDQMNAATEEAGKAMNDFQVEELNGYETEKRKLEEKYEIEKAKLEAKHQALLRLLADKYEEGHEDFLKRKERFLEKRTKAFEKKERAEDRLAKSIEALNNEIQWYHQQVRTVIDAKPLPPWPDAPDVTIFGLPPIGDPTPEQNSFYDL